MTELKQRILTAVQKPARYTGGEWGEVKKDPSQVRVRVAFCFPDRYVQSGYADSVRRDERDGRRLV